MEPEKPEPTINKTYTFNDKDLVVKKGWPGECSGNLLAWLAREMGSVEELDAVSYVEVSHWRVVVDGGTRGTTVSEKTGTRDTYAFNKEDFDFQFQSRFGTVEEIQELDRFVMRDGSSYVVEPCDGEYRQTGLLYVPPVSQPAELKLGLKAIMRPENRNKRVKGGQ